MLVTQSVRCRIASPARSIRTMTASSALEDTSKQAELKVSRPVRIAIEAMVWQGMKREDAAQHAGMKDNSLYVALRRPDVKRFYMAELDVLRTSQRARNIHRAVEIRDESKNHAAAMNAIRYLDQMPDEQAASRGGQSSPGMVIIVNAGTPLTQPPTIDGEYAVKSDG